LTRRPRLGLLTGFFSDGTLPSGSVQRHLLAGTLPRGPDVAAGTLPQGPCRKDHRDLVGPCFSPGRCQTASQRDFFASTLSRACSEPVLLPGSVSDGTLPQGPRHRVQDRPPFWHTPGPHSPDPRRLRAPRRRSGFVLSPATRHVARPGPRVVVDAPPPRRRRARQDARVLLPLGECFGCTCKGPDVPLARDSGIDRFRLLRWP